MAVVTPRKITTPVDGANVSLYVWENLGASDTGKPVIVAPYSDKTVQIDGSTLGSGITIQVSCDPRELTSTDGSVIGAGWDTANDPQGNPLSGITDQRVENILEHSYLLRPSCAAGVSGANVFLLLASTR